MQSLNRKIFGSIFLFFFLSMFFVPLITNAIEATSTGNGLDLNEIGETSKGIFKKISDWFNNWWNGTGSSWVKNIYYKTISFLNKDIVIK